jgi:hypothetical protein
MMKSDHDNIQPNPSNENLSGADALAGAEQEQLDFEKEFAALGGLDLREYFKYYPDYLKDELLSLFDDARLSREGPFFALNLDVPSPLVWLLLNQPNSFLFACEKCIVEYKKKLGEYGAGAKDRMGSEEQREILRLREEIESYLLNLDLHFYQAKLQKQTADMYIRMSELNDAEEKEDYKLEYIEPFLQEHNWIFDAKTVKSIELRIQSLFATVTDLYNLLNARGLFEVMVFEEDGVKF